jgi:hypothetical protein
MKTRIFPLVRAVRRGTVPVYAYALLACILLLSAFEWPLVSGARIIGYDSMSILYPWYVNALEAFHHSVYTFFDPYGAGGFFSFNLFANFDPIYMLPAIVNVIPTLYQDQLLVLLHFLLVPMALTSLAALYRLRGGRLVLFVALAVSATLAEPVYKYMENSDAVDAYGWGFVALAALEYYRVRGKLAYLAVAALSFDFAMMRFATGAVFWPIIVAAYAVAFWPELRSHRQLFRDFGIAVLIIVVVFLPNLLEQGALWHTIQATVNLQPVLAALPTDALSFFGYRMTNDVVVQVPGSQNVGSQGPSLMIVPAAYALMFIVALRAMPRRAAIALGIAVAVLCVYALGARTPFEPVFRALYFPAGLFRRPYACFMVVVPLVAVLSMRYSFESDRVPFEHAVAAFFTILAILAVWLLPEMWVWQLFVLLTVLLCIYLFRYKWAVAALLLMQWIMVIWYPTQISFYGPRPNNTAEEGFNAVRLFANYLSPDTSDSVRLFRTAGIYVEPQFGSYASIFRYYALFPLVGTRLPRELFRVTNLTGLRAEQIADSVRKRPWVIAGPALRSMAVRYYVFNPRVSDIEATVVRLHPELRRRPAEYWHVYEDPRARPFVSAYSANGKFLAGVPATVDWDTVKLTVPQDAAFVKLAFLYNNWWTSRPHLRTIDAGGQLQLDTRGAAGKEIVLHFTNRWLVAAITMQIFCYLLLIGWAGYALVSAALRPVRIATEEPRPETG